MPNFSFRPRLVARSQNGISASAAAGPPVWTYMFFKRLANASFAFLLWVAGVGSTGSLAAGEPGADLHPPIAIRFTLARPGFVTLAIDDAGGGAADGSRVRNLVSEQPFPAGENVAWWDGLDDLARNTDAAAHAVYHVPGKLVSPGKYQVRGLVRPALDLRYEMTPYNEGRPPWPTKDRASEWLANHTAQRGAVPSAGCRSAAGRARGAGGAGARRQLRQRRRQRSGLARHRGAQNPRPTVGRRRLDRRHPPDPRCRRKGGSRRLCIYRGGMAGG